MRVVESIAEAREEFVAGRPFSADFCPGNATRYVLAMVPAAGMPSATGPDEWLVAVVNFDRCHVVPLEYGPPTPSSLSRRLGVAPADACAVALFLGALTETWGQCSLGDAGIRTKGGLEMAEEWGLVEAGKFPMGAES